MMLIEMYEFYLNHLQAYFPAAFEDEEVSDDGPRQMLNVYQIKFDLGVDLDESKIHENERPGVFCFPIDISEQRGQKILGIREDSVAAYWNIDGNKRRIARRDGVDQAEYVSIRVDENSTKFDIEFSFNRKEIAASHFEFEFKVRVLP